MRPQQWMKNLFVLTPLLFGQKLGDPEAIGRALLAAVAFCLLSSALYILNDLIDAPTDRLHPEKRFRPIAAGTLPMAVAWLGFGGLLLMALWMSVLLGPGFLRPAVAYGSLTLGYSVAFKRIMILDGMVIAGGFVLRVLGGAAAVTVAPTHWLIACTFLLSLFLAFAKRRQELVLLSETAGQHRRVLGEYTVGYLDQVNNLVLGATIVCYALYTVAPETVARFGTDRLIYGSVFVIYGLLRYMALVQDPAKGGEPGRLLVQDRPLLLAMLGWAVYNALVIYRVPVRALWSFLP